MQFHYIAYSLEANHLIWVWIMKIIKGPKNQADFIEVLYVVVNALAPFFEIHIEVIPIGFQKWCPRGVTGPPKDEIYI